MYTKLYIFPFQTIEKQILEKPVDKEDAYKMLSRFILLKYIEYEDTFPISLILNYVYVAGNC